MKILVTGGTGYIGSHTIVDLLDNGFEVVCVDNQSNSELTVLDGIARITGKRVDNYSHDLCDLNATEQIFVDHNIIGVIHFAAFKSVGESVDMPLEYYHNNNTSLWNLLYCIKKYRVFNFIFSSSCSVYGNATELPVTEKTELQEAECPYARTKQIGEQMITDFAVPYPKHQFILLRYFNPAGAHESAIIGESARNKATNLVPVITETGIGKRDSMTVFGNDYDTRDGSCIRDYIHVMDLANAHTRALQYLIDSRNDDQVEIFNLGIGEGASVMEAINAFEKVTQKSLNYEIGPRRAGDVVAVYADNSKARQRLGWNPTRNIEDIMRTAWEWEKTRSDEG